MNPNDVSPDEGAPKPWHKPQPGDENDNSSAADAGSNAANIIGGVAEGAGEIAGGALEVAGGCADGCGGCSLAILITLFAAGGTAMALFR
jgi:hypothetical protein